MGQPTNRRRGCALALGVVTLLLAACDSQPPTPSPSLPVASTPASPSPSPDSSSSAAPSATPVPSSSAAPTPTSSPSTAPSSESEAWPYRATGEIAQALFPADGRVITVERDVNADRFAVQTLDPRGHAMAGWPWSLDTGSPIARVALGSADTLYVAVRGESGSPIHYTWTLHHLSIAGQELAGFPIDLPAVSFCDLQSAAGVAYVSCEAEDENGDVTGSILTAVGPDGTSPWPAPARFTPTANLIGFLHGQPVLSIGEADQAVIRALAADGSTLWSTRAISGDAFVDPQGRVRVTRHEFQEDACGDPIRTTYEVIGTNGARVSGWPVVVRGWASAPAVLGDGSMVAVTAGGRALRYGLHGRVPTGWPLRNVDVSFSCADGSQPAYAGDRIVVVGASRVTALNPAGRGFGRWIANPQGDIAISCPSCTPGSGATVAPVLGSASTYVGVYDARRRPRVVALGPGGISRGPGVVVGGAGAELVSIELGAGRVWAVTSRSGGDVITGRISLVAEDVPPGP